MILLPFTHQANINNQEFIQDCMQGGKGGVEESQKVYLHESGEVTTMKQIVG